MSERYSKVFSLPENLYAEGAPVVIAAGALLKDNQTGRVVAQLKLRNISPKTIKAATVCLSPMNTVGNPLGDAVSYEYLDLNSTRDTDFGSKSAISMPDITTRSFDAAVVEVIFTDNSVWNANEAAWEALKSPEALTSRLDNEMVKQFQIEYGSGAKNFFLEQKDLWYCVCGAVNRRGETKCHSCRKPIYDLKKLDLEALKERKEKRLVEERERTEKAKAVAQENIRKKVKIAAAVVTILIVFVILVNAIIIPSREYKDAERLSNRGEIAEAAITFGKLGSFRDSQRQSLALWEKIVERKTVSAGEDHTVGLKTNGTVIAVGDNQYGQCDTLDWENIVSIAPGDHHTVGLKADGTVVSVGQNDSGQCNVTEWKGIVSITAGSWHTVGLKADGTVVAVGSNGSGQCNVIGWTDIIAIAAGRTHTVGLKADGTVVAVGKNYGSHDASDWTKDWTNVVAIDAHGGCTAGLRADGTVVTFADDNIAAPMDAFYYQYGHSSDWKNIVAIAIGTEHTVGLKTNGTVVAEGINMTGGCDTSDWTDIVAIAAGDLCTVGLKANGTVVAVGDNEKGQCNVSDWTDIKLP